MAMSTAGAAVAATGAASRARSPTTETDIQALIDSLLPTRCRPIEPFFCSEDMSFQHFMAKISRVGGTV